MNMQRIASYIAQKCAETAQEVNADASLRITKFKVASTQEKAWILFKTFSVAVACGLIALVATATLGTSIVVPVIAAVVVGGVYAFYRSTRPANYEEFAEKAVRRVGGGDDAQGAVVQAVAQTKKIVKKGAEAVTNAFGNSSTKKNNKPNHYDQYSYHSDSD